MFHIADLITLDTANASYPIDTKTDSIFCQNEEVLSRWNDGLLYIGNVLQVIEYRVLQASLRPRTRLISNTV